MTSTDQQPQPGLRELGDTSGLGQPPESPITTLPALEQEFHGIVLDPYTGEPKRPAPIKAATAAFAAASVFSFVVYWIYWWRAIHMATFPQSATLISWVDPRPGSALSVVMVCVMAVLGVVMTAGPAVAGYNVWHGASWAKAASVAGAVTGLLAVFFTPWAFIALALSVVGLVMVWLPASARFFADFETFREPVAEPFEPPTWVNYGPLPRYLGDNQ